MEADLAVLCQCSNEAQQMLYQEFLQEDTRPLLDDDVLPEQRALFNVLDDIEDVEFAAKQEGNVLALHWFLGGGDFISYCEEILEALIKGGGVTCLNAAVYLDGELSVLVNGTNASGLTFHHDVTLAKEGDDDLFAPLSVQAS